MKRTFTLTLLFCSLGVLSAGCHTLSNRSSGSESLAQAGYEPVAPVRDADWILATRARAALWQDPALGAMPLEIVVRDGVATLHGTCPSEESRLRATELISALPGIRSVRNLARLQPSPSESIAGPRQFAAVDAPKPRMAEPAVQVSPPLRIASHPEPSRAILTNQPHIHPKDKSAPSAAVDASSDLAFSIERVLKSNTRFQQIRFRLSGRTVELSGVLADAAELEDLIRAIAAVAGVQRVQHGSVTTKESSEQRE